MHRLVTTSHIGETASRVRDRSRVVKASSSMVISSRVVRTCSVLPDLGLPGELVAARGYIPDFLNPPAATASPSLEAELGAIAATDHQRIRADLDDFDRWTPSIQELYDDPAASTTELARRTGLSAAGVSQHLTALRAAGIVSSHRSGRSVLYRRTAIAESLLSASAH